MDTQPTIGIDLRPVARLGDRVMWTPKDAPRRRGVIEGLGLDNNEIGVRLEGETEVRLIPQDELLLFVSLAPKRGYDG